MKISLLSGVDTALPANAANRDAVLARELRNCGHEVFPIVPRCAPARLHERLCMAVFNRLGLRQERSPIVLRQVARTIEDALRQQPVDLVLSLSSMFTPFINTRIPVVMWADAVFECSVDFYEWHTGFVVRDAANPEAYLDSLRLLASHPELAADMGENARSFYETRMSSDVIMQELCALLEYAVEIHRS